MFLLGLFMDAKGAIGSMFGLAKESPTKSKIGMIAFVAVIILLIWGWSKYDAYKIKQLELKNQALTLENASVVKATKEITAINAIDEIIVTETIVEIKQIATETEAIKSSVRNDIFNLQMNWNHEKQEDTIFSDYDPNTATVKPFPTIPTNPIETNHENNCYQKDSCGFDIRVVNSILSGMWDSYCSSMEDDYKCTQRRIANGSVPIPTP
jgi:uncharacterized protein YfeS